MKFALIQPNWEFQGSTYFGCRETHLPLELLFARRQLEAAGHETMLLDAHLEGLRIDAAKARVDAFAPDFLVVTTAPTYLFWRCPQPELRLPAAWMRGLSAPGRIGVAIGPHASATPRTTLTKMDAAVALRGEPDHTLAQLASRPWDRIEGCVWRDAEGWRQTAGTPQADLRALPALDYGGYPLPRRRHRHHVFHGTGRGAEVEFSRGCPWACTFCNKTLFRNRFRERTVEAVTAEIEALARAGIDYVYFIDEIFGCGRSTPALLAALETLPVQFGIQTRIDLWDEAGLEALGRAHCISFECGIESVDAGGRERFRKGCRLDNDRIAGLLRTARRHIPWVQANLIAGEGDDEAAIAAWRAGLIEAGVWASRPVPAFAFPGSPLYTQLFGAPDDEAWERAHRHYLESRRPLSDIQDPMPLPLDSLERAPAA